MPSTSLAALRRFFGAASPAADSPQAHDPPSAHAPSAARPGHHLTEHLPPRPPAPCTQAASARGERRRSLQDLPADVLFKLGSSMKSRPGVIDLALAAPSIQLALQPADRSERFEFLKEMARSANDPDSVRLVLRSARSQPAALHAALIEPLIAGLHRLANAGGSFFAMRAAATEAAERFRLLADDVAELPSPQRAGLSVMLLHHLKLLPPDERYGAMKLLLGQASGQAERFEAIHCLALGIGQFSHPDICTIAQDLIDASADLPLAERSKLEGSFRMGMSCKMLEADRARIGQMLARWVDNPGPPPRGPETTVPPRLTSPETPPPQPPAGATAP